MADIISTYRVSHKAPTANRSFLTLDAACRAEANAIVGRKYPSEKAEFDGATCTYVGWHFYDEPRFVALRDRVAKILKARHRAGPAPTRAAPKVKPLVWSSWGGEYDANSPFGTFTIKIDGHSGYYAYLNGDKILNDLHDKFDRSTPEHPMDQCQKYVDGKILAAIEGQGE